MEQAVEAYRKALALEPGLVFALTSLGDALYGQGENEAALATYRKALEWDPQDAQAHFSLAEMYYDTGDLGAAEAECRQALRLDPGLTYAYLTLGNACLDQENLRQAVTAFEEFLSRERSPAASEVREEVKLLLEGLREQL